MVSPGVSGHPDFFCWMLGSVHSRHVCSVCCSHGFSHVLLRPLSVLAQPQVPEVPSPLASGFALCLASIVGKAQVEAVLQSGLTFLWPGGPL